MRLHVGNNAMEYPNTQYNVIKTTIVAVTCISVAAFGAGTGGVLTPRGLKNLSDQYYTPKIHIEQREKKLDIKSPIEHIAFIRDIFSLNTSDLAAILNVSRPTIYAWLDGQEPKPEKIPYIQKLSLGAQRMKALNIIRIDSLVRRPIFNGSSFIDKLKNEEDITPYLEILKKLSDKEVNARKIQKGPKDESLRSISDVANSYSIPLYNKG